LTRLKRASSTPKILNVTVNQFILMGDINIDCVWPVDHIPTTGEEAIVERVAVGLGGAVLNSAIMLDKLGAKTILLGCVGDDLWGEYFLKQVAGTAIDLSRLQIVPDHGTGMDFIIVTPDGERTMFGYRGANAQLLPDSIDKGIFNEGVMLHLSGYSLLEGPQSDAVRKAVRYAKAELAAISMDTAFEPVLRNQTSFKEILPALAICISGEKEVNALFGTSTYETAARALLDAGVKIAVIKRGAQGSYVASAGEAYEIPAFPVDPVDTTGASDAFTAGFIFGAANGLDPLSCGLLGSALGAMAAVVEGAGLAMPDRESVRRFLNTIEPLEVENFNSSLEIIATLL